MIVIGAQTLAEAGEPTAKSSHPLFCGVGCRHPVRNFLLKAETKAGSRNEKGLEPHSWEWRDVIGWAPAMLSPFRQRTFIRMRPSTRLKEIS